MDATSEARLLPTAGLVGNANQGGSRQVTVIEAEVWDRLSRQAGTDLDPAIRRANLMIKGVDLRDSRGRGLRVGECTLRIRGETKACHRMDEAHAGLREAMAPDWAGGTYGEVEDGGTIRVGDPVCWSE
jgi:MOSC domain-containing protein YiiM